MMEEVKNWLKNSELDDESVRIFLANMESAEIKYKEFADNATILHHPKLGIWVVTRYGTVFSSPPDIESPFEYRGKITLFANECMEFTFDLQTGKLIKVRQS